MKNLPGIIYLCALRDLKRMCHRKLYPQITETPTTETANGKLSLSLSFYLFLPAYSVCRSYSCTCNGVAFSHSNELMHEIYNKQMGYGCQTREIWCQMKMLRSISQRDTKIHQLILRIFHVLQLQLSTSNTLFMFFKSINNRCAIP